MHNPYLPYPVRIDGITTETEDKNLKTFKFVFLNPGDEEKFDYRAGQFAELSVAGKGEIPIGIASSPTEPGFVMFTVNKVGLVSSFLHSMNVGDIMGVRGPMGNWYPWDTLEGKKVAMWLSATEDQLFAGKGAELYDVLEKLLKEKYPDIEIVSYRDLPMKFAPEDEVVTAILEAQPDAVVAGFGG